MLKQVRRAGEKREGAGLDRVSQLAPQPWQGCHPASGLPNLGGIVDAGPVKALLVWVSTTDSSGMLLAGTKIG